MMRIARTPQLAPELPRQLAAAGVGLVTLDLDKVLADYGSPQVYPEAPAFVDDLRRHDITPVIATNCRRPDRLADISRQLGGVLVLHRSFEHETPLRPKPHPSMLLAARQLTGATGKAVHIDDQLKAGWAAHKAGFDGFLWVRARGSVWDDHPGTVPLRLLEMPIAAYLAMLGERLSL
jgi:FMN phosphatase YigB (HAD superfamily)